MSGRLVPFERGNVEGRTHGLYAPLSTSGRATEIADSLREVVPARAPADEAAIALLANILARVESAHAYLAERGLMDSRGTPRSLLKHLSTMENTASRLFRDLGLTPLSRAQLGLDVARARGEALRSHLAEHYGEGE